MQEVFESPPVCDLFMSTWHSRSSLSMSSKFQHEILAVVGKLFILLVVNNLLNSFSLSLQKFQQEIVLELD